MTQPATLLEPDKQQPQPAEPAEPAELSRIERARRAREDAADRVERDYKAINAAATQDKRRWRTREPLNLRNLDKR